MVEDWDSGCDHVTDGGDGQPDAYCDDNIHLKPDIFERWRQSLNGHAKHYEGDTKRERITVWRRRIGLYTHALLKGDSEYHKAHLTLEDVVAPLQREVWATIHSSLFDTQWAVYRPPHDLSDEEALALLPDILASAWRMFCEQDRNALLLHNGLDLGAALGKLPDVPPPKNPAGMMLVKDYLTMFAERASRPFIWEETLYAGAFNMLVGRPFAGKSSFAAALLRAVTLELPLMGRSCKAVTCGYLALERNGAVVAKLLADWGLSDKVLFADEIAAENAIDFIEGEVKRHSLGFLVIDHLQHATRITESSSYSEVSNALMPYQAIARTSGCCILALHHQAKPQGEEKRRAPEDTDRIEVMGSEAFAGSADTLMEASQFHGKYYVRVHTRTGSDLPRMETDIDFETGEMNVTDPAEAERATATERITTLLFRCQEPQTEAEIKKAIGGNGNTFVTALRQAVRNDVVTRLGRGGKADPFRYFIANGSDDEPEQESEP